MLSIIIVNFKNPALLRLCLSSLTTNVSPELPYEVIVIDVASTAETQQIVRDEFSTVFKNIKLVPFRENIGYTKGVNEGIKHSTGDYILNLNPDILLIKNSVEQLLGYLKEHPEIGLIGPQLRSFDNTIQPSCFRFYTPLTILYRRVQYLPFAKTMVKKFLMNDQDLSRTVQADWLMGSALLTSRAAIEKVGLMDEQFFLYMSDVDWAQRFWENGYTVVYYPHASIYHYHRRESKGKFGIFDAILNRQTRWHIQDALKYLWKYGITGKRRKTNS